MAKCGNNFQFQSNMGKKNGTTICDMNNVVSRKSNLFETIHSKTAVDILVHSKTAVPASHFVSEDTLTNIISGNTKPATTSHPPTNTSYQYHLSSTDKEEFLTDNRIDTRAYGKFNTYPEGILNPAFCGMVLWELKRDHILNEFRINKFHNIRNGIILHNMTAYVFTPICNDDIHSHLKILIRGKQLRHNIPPSKGATILRKYVRQHSQRVTIPCINEIQNSLYNMLGLSEKEYINDRTSYLTLLHRLYLLMFMLHYKMPLQRTCAPGERNKAKQLQAITKKGWYSTLKPVEQKLLNCEHTHLASSQIPDDPLYGILRINSNVSVLSSNDILNSTMFRDGSMDNMRFQYMILKFQRNPSYRNKHNIIPISEDKSLLENISTVEKRRNTDMQLLEAPSTKRLKETINLKTDKDFQAKYHNVHEKTWNQMFHDTIDMCDLQTKINLETLPDCYRRGSSCSHVFHIDMEQTISNTLDLTLLEKTKSQNDKPYISNQTVSSFINCVTRRNPVWDLGLQFLYMNTNPDRMYGNLTAEAKGYTRMCICPCSDILSSWHQYHSFHTFPRFKVCKSGTFEDPFEFVHHIQLQNDDFYHRIIMRIIQSSYSSLLAKFKMKVNERVEQSFHAIHKGTVTLPPNVATNATYKVFQVTKYV